MAKIGNRPGHRSRERARTRYRRTGRRSFRRGNGVEAQEVKSHHNIEHLYGSLGNGERTNRNFDDIQQEADEKYFRWKQSEGRFKWRRFG